MSNEEKFAGAEAEADTSVESGVEPQKSWWGGLGTSQKRWVLIASAVGAGVLLAAGSNLLGGSGDGDLSEDHPAGKVEAQAGFDHSWEAGQAWVQAVVVDGDLSEACSLMTPQAQNHVSDAYGGAGCESGLASHLEAYDFLFGENFYAGSGVEHVMESDQAWLEEQESDPQALANGIRVRFHEEGNPPAVGTINEGFFGVPVEKDAEGKWLVGDLMIEPDA